MSQSGDKTSESKQSLGGSHSSVPECPGITQRVVQTADEDKEESKKAQGGPHSTSSEEIGTPFSEDEREGETDIPSPHGKKRTASEDSKRETSKRGKVSQSRGDVDTQSPRKDRPSAAS